MLFSSIRDMFWRTSSIFPYLIDFMAYSSEKITILVLSWLYVES